MSFHIYFQITSSVEPSSLNSHHPTQRVSDQPSLHPVCIVHIKGIKYRDLQLLSGVKDADGKLA